MAALPGDESPLNGGRYSPIMLHDIRRYDGETTGKHIVLLKPGASKAELLVNLSTMNADVTHDWDFINAFASASEPSRFSSTAVGLTVPLTYIRCDKAFSMMSLSTLSAAPRASRASKRTAFFVSHSAALNTVFSVSVPLSLARSSSCSAFPTKGS